MFLNQYKNAGVEKDKLSFGLLPNKNAALKKKKNSSDWKLSRFWKIKDPINFKSRCFKTLFVDYM